MEKRVFSKEEKLAIIKEVSINAVTTTLEKHGIYPASYYSWKKKFESMGERGL
ncbi:MAG TPA: transposase [Fermentimonas sp.]|nr:transposase [Fermentimonas sp.]